MIAGPVIGEEAAGAASWTTTDPRGQIPIYSTNFDLTHIKTPLRVQRYKELLRDYDEKETEFLVNGFSQGFPIGFEGPFENDHFAPNLISAVQQPKLLWQHVMKEVQAQRYAGPFDTPPFQKFWQSPLGLVPKKGTDKLHLIFHLGYPHGGLSINSGTPERKKSVKYPAFDKAIELCKKKGPGCFLAKTDLASAFRQLPLRVEDYPLLGMKAKNPATGELQWFVDKCLPFGAGISCSHFQRFSNSLKHITESMTLEELLNYLDDFLFADDKENSCNQQISTFLWICDWLGLPTAPDKTEWAAQVIVFLGLLIGTINQLIAIPEEKIERGLKAIDAMLKAKTATAKQVQSLAGLLNFFCRAVTPGRAFNRRLYDLLTPAKHGSHHVNITAEVKEDLRVWKTFLTTKPHFREFLDTDVTTAEEIGFYTDVSGNPGLGFSCYFHPHWTYEQWDKQLFLQEAKPDISWLKLYALVLAVTLWGNHLHNKRVILRCDNQAVVGMVNANTTPEKHCMKLVLILVSVAMKYNCRLYARYIQTDENCCADALSRLNIPRFFQHAKQGVSQLPAIIPASLWPASKIRKTGSSQEAWHLQQPKNTMTSGVPSWNSRVG